MSGEAPSQPAARGRNQNTVRHSRCSAGRRYLIDCPLHPRRASFLRLPARRERKHRNRNRFSSSRFLPLSFSRTKPGGRPARDLRISLSSSVFIFLLFLSALAPRARDSSESSRGFVGFQRHGRGNSAPCQRSCETTRLRSTSSVARNLSCLAPVLARAACVCPICSARCYR